MGNPDFVSYRCFYEFLYRRRRRIVMADLKCGVENCTYNKDRLCSKGDIMVGGRHACDCEDTCCESFAERREGRDAYTSSWTIPAGPSALTVRR